jgi:hypothetical protein
MVVFLIATMVTMVFPQTAIRLRMGIDVNTKNPIKHMLIVNGRASGVVSCELRVKRLSPYNSGAALQPCERLRSSNQRGTAQDMKHTRNSTP